MSLLGRVDFNNLSEVERAIFQYISSNSEKVAYMRVREIASESHTSASSVMRFIHKLGYDSFTEFRMQFRLPATETGEFFTRLNLLKAENFPHDIETRLYQLADKILNCENLIFVGMGSSAILCEYAARQFALYGCNTFALVDYTYPIFAKLRNTSDNLVICLSVSGTTTEVVEMANSFRNQPDFTTAAITSDASSTLASLSDYVLTYQVNRRQIRLHEDVTSQIPCLFLLESLAEAVYQLQAS